MRASPHQIWANMIQRKLSSAELRQAADRNHATRGWPALPSCAFNFMIALWIVGGVLMLIVGWLLFVPVFIRASTVQQVYQVTMYPLEVCFCTNPWRIVVRVWGWEKSFPILPAKARKPGASKSKPRARKPFPYRKIRALLASFRVQRFWLKLDTGDYALNGPLYPLLWWVSRWAGPAYRCEINFNGEWAFECDIENRVVRMLPALWK